MTIKTTIACSFAAIMTICAFQAGAFEVNVTTPKGEELNLEFQEGESFQTVLEVVKSCLVDQYPDGAALQMSFPVDQDDGTIKASVCQKAPPRNYYAAVSADEKKNLTYILRTLANNSLAKIAKEKSSLKRAGDRIENLHPFKFLETVFTDEELKVCIRALEGKSWVWSEFRDGITKSLADESAAGNIKPEHIQSLADTIKIDVNQIASTIHEKKWTKLLTDLIAIVPRSGGSDRYNM